MTQRKAFTFLSSATASNASGSYLTDYRFEDGSAKRTIQGTLTGGSAVALYTYVHPTDETTGVLVSSYTTSSFTAVIEGPVAKIKVIKTSATGVADVQGLV